MQLAGALQLLARLLQLGAATHALRLAWPNSGEVIQAITWPAFTFWPGCASMRATCPASGVRSALERVSSQTTRPGSCRLALAPAVTSSLRSTSSWRLPAGNRIWPALICGASSV
jgi:hypothetical protein